VPFSKRLAIFSEPLKSSNHLEIFSLFKTSTSSLIMSSLFFSASSISVYIFAIP
jgi:hypothetical protein